MEPVEETRWGEVGFQNVFAGYCSTLDLGLLEVLFYCYYDLVLSEEIFTTRGLSLEFANWDLPFFFLADKSIVIITGSSSSSSVKLSAYYFFYYNYYYY